MSKPTSPTTSGKDKDFKAKDGKDHHHGHHNRHKSDDSAGLSSQPRSPVPALSKIPKSSVLLLKQAAASFPRPVPVHNSNADDDAAGAATTAVSEVASLHQKWCAAIHVAVAPVASAVHVVELPELGTAPSPTQTPPPPSKNLEAVISALQQHNQAAAVVATHASQLVLLLAVNNAARGQVFLVMADAQVSTDPALRLAATDRFGVHMKTHVPAQLTTALAPVCAVAPEMDRSPATGPYQCPFCGMRNLNAIELWHHCQLFHIDVKNKSMPNDMCCPICAQPVGQTIFVHLHDAHAPPGTHLDARSDMRVHSFALVCVRRKSDGKWLVVEEYSKQGFWLPGGGVDAAEQPWDGAIRECREEAGVRVKLTGLLRVETAPHARRGSGYLRLRYIFYGEPVDESTCAQETKTAPDFESAGACWVTLAELTNGAVRLRGQEPIDYFTYVERGGVIAPIFIVGIEGAEPGVAPGQM